MQVFFNYFSELDTRHITCVADYQHIDLKRTQLSMTVFNIQGSTLIFVTNGLMATKMVVLPSQRPLSTSHKNFPTQNSAEHNTTFRKAFITSSTLGDKPGN